MADWIEKNWQELTPHEKNQALVMNWKRAKRMLLGLSGGGTLCVLWIKGNFIGSQNKYSRYFLWSIPIFMVYGCDYPFRAEYNKLCEAIKENHQDKIED
ncbi:unnamed protein product [Blepharisma stoltei]|uniref:Uncharacterized protein n=1 Tax=Blepharisma stoltei TaxID=1481888 RepID=A0AAU9JWM7_9CILI|nr:unnamed protein product [Blepharisma stoltei]